MNKEGVLGCRPTVGLVLVMAVTVVVAAGCCFATRQAGEGEAVVGQPVPAEATPILVTLAADEGEALAATRERVLTHLRMIMPAEAFAAIRTYETLPIVALVATPDTIAALLTSPDVRSIEADRSFETL